MLKRELLILFRAPAARLASVTYLVGLTVVNFWLQGRLSEASVGAQPPHIATFSEAQWLILILLCPVTIASVSLWERSPSIYETVLASPFQVLFRRSLAHLVYQSMLVLAGLPALVVLSLSGWATGEEILVRYTALLACTWIVIQFCFLACLRWGDRVETFVAAYTGVACVVVIRQLAGQEPVPLRLAMAALLVAVLIPFLLARSSRRGLAQRG